MCEAGLYTVFVPFLRPSSVPLSQAEFPIEQLFGDPGVIHANDMSCPTQLRFHDHCFNACRLRPVQDLEICDPVLPFDAKDGAQASHVELFQQFDMMSIQGPGLTSIEKAGEDDCFVDLQLCRLLDVVLVQDARAKSAEGLACFADPCVDLFVKGTITGYEDCQGT